MKAVLQRAAEASIIIDGVLSLIHIWAYDEPPPDGQGELY